MKMNQSTLRKMYYAAKPVMPRSLQLALRRQWIAKRTPMFEQVWPIDPSTVKSRPYNWRGWPQGKQFAFVLTHDVELQGGHDKCLQLLRLEEELGFRSSFNFVPERYNVSPLLRKQIAESGFEVGVHGLNHDGKLYASQQVFEKRAAKINGYLRDWDAVGFRSPAMHHNLEWLRKLNVLYDASTFDVDPFEPQSDGVGAIFPFKVGGDSGYIEMPYTLPQDFTLFILLGEKNASIWKKKLDWLAENGGMALVNVHPDYLNFGDSPMKREEFPVEIYHEFLTYVKTEYAGAYWHALPRETATFWKERRTANKRQLAA